MDQQHQPPEFPQQAAESEVRKQLAQSDEALRVLELERDEFRVRCEEAQAEANKARQSEERALSRVTALETSSATLEKALSRAQVENETLHKQREHDEGVVFSKQERIQELESQVGANMKAVKTSQDKAEERNQEVAVLKHDLSTEVGKVKKLMRENSQLQEERDAFKSQLAELEESQTVAEENHARALDQLRGELIAVKEVLRSSQDAEAQAWEVVERLETRVQDHLSMFGSGDADKLLKEANLRFDGLQDQIQGLIKLNSELEKKLQSKDRDVPPKGPEMDLAKELEKEPFGDAPVIGSEEEGRETEEDGRETEEEDGETEEEGRETEEEDRETEEKGRETEEEDRETEEEVKAEEAKTQSKVSSSWLWAILLLVVVVSRFVVDYAVLSSSRDAWLGANQATGLVVSSADMTWIDWTVDRLGVEKIIYSWETYISLDRALLG